MTRLVRAKSARHWEDIDRLQRLTLPGDRPHPTNSGAWWLIYDGEQPVAFAGVVPSARWCDAMYLCRSGVIESHRGRGLQKRLVRVRERYARKQGMRWLITDTTRNPASSNSLIAAGYKIFEPSKPWGLKHATYWRKDILKAPK